MGSSPISSFRDVVRPVLPRPGNLQPVLSLYFHGSQFFVNMRTTHVAFLSSQAVALRRSDHLLAVSCGLFPWRCLSGWSNFPAKFIAELGEWQRVTLSEQSLT